MLKTTRRSQAEIVATYIGWDIADVKDMAYQPTVYANTKVFSISNGNSSAMYLCSPLNGRKPPEPEHFNWQPIGVALGRTVYASSPAKTA